jgi:hypothetical protein
MSLTTLHAVGVALQAYLREQGCPLDVIDGPEATTTTTWGRERIVIEYDDSGKDSFSGPRGLHVNAKHRKTAIDACKLTIYARSARGGAAEFEHRARAKLIRETVIAGLDYVAAVNKNRWEPTSGAIITPADLAKTEQQGGAVYELLFTYELPIRVVSFVGEAQPEGTLTGLISSTKVALNGVETTTNEPPADADTACGA